MFRVAKIGGGIAAEDGPVHFGGKSGVPTHSLASIFRSGGLCMVDGVGWRGSVVVEIVVVWSGWRVARGQFVCRDRANKRRWRRSAKAATCKAANASRDAREPIRSGKVSLR